MANALDLVVAKLNQKFKKDVIKMGTSQIYVDKIPFSSPRTNHMTYGGVPIGKGTELLGGEGGGKTTSALDLTGQAQRKARREHAKALHDLQVEIDELEEKGNKSEVKRLDKIKKELQALEERGPRRCVYLDLENTLDEEWAEKLGVNLDELYLMKPDDETAEEVLQMVLDLIESGMIIMLVIDSLPMLVSQKVFEEDLSKKQYGGIAGAVGDFCGRVSPALARNHTALVIINQLREDLNNPHNQFHTSGGRALKHFYSLRLAFRKGSLLNSDNEEVPMRTADPFGNMVDVTIVKTKVCKPDRRVGQFTINYERAIDVVFDTVFMALHFKLIAKSGAWYSLINADGEVLEDSEGELKFQGMSKLLAFLREDEEIFDEIYEAVHAKMAEV